MDKMQWKKQEKNDTKQYDEYGSEDTRYLKR